MYTTVTPSATMRWVLALGRHHPLLPALDLDTGYLADWQLAHVPGYRLPQCLDEAGGRIHTRAWPSAGTSTAACSWASRLPMPSLRPSASWPVELALGGRESGSRRLCRRAGTGIHARRFCRPDARGHHGGWGFGSDSLRRHELAGPDQLAVRRRPGVGQPAGYMFMGAGTDGHKICSRVLETGLRDLTTRAPQLACSWLGPAFLRSCQWHRQGTAPRGHYPVTNAAAAFRNGV